MDNADEFIREAFRPIKLLSLKIDKDKKVAWLTVTEEDLSKAIGRRGQNARLTSRLVNYELNIDKDETAAEHFAAQLGGAVHELADALGISESIASRLVQNGLNDVNSFAGVDASDIADMLDGDTELAEQILSKVSSL